MKKETLRRAVGHIEGDTFEMYGKPFTQEELFDMVESALELDYPEDEITGAFDELLEYLVDNKILDRYTGCYYISDEYYENKVREDVNRHLNRIRDEVIEISSYLQKRGFDDDGMEYLFGAEVGNTYKNILERAE